MLELTVKTLDSQNHSFTVPDETTVRQLKESILEKMEVPVEIQRLIFHGKVLQDEKKLTDYGDVNGKVIHLVQRPPPPARAPNNGTTTDNNMRPNIRRSLFSRDRLDGSNATYLGAMAFPTDLMEAQGMIHPRPSQGLSRSRLFVAQRMLNNASTSIGGLENINSQATQPEDAEIQEPQAEAAPAPANPTEEVREDAEVFLAEANGSIAQAAQAATAAAIAAAVSAAQAAGVPHITITRGASGQSETSIPTAESSSTSVNDVNVNVNVNIHDHHPEDVAVEVEIGGNSDISIDERQENSTNTNNLEFNVPTANNQNPNRRTVERTSAFATLLEQLEEQQRRFQPLLRRCHQLMVDDPSFTENSSPNVEECQRLFNGVSETMHHFAHAYHALSDIMVDFNEDTPRTLRCRPVIIQHSAILETGIPIQAQINLSARRPNNNASNSNLSSTYSSQPSVDANSTSSRNQDAEAAGNSASAPEASQDRANESLNAQESFTSATNQPEERPQSAQSGNGNNSSGFFLSGPGNVEIFMDFGPEGVTLGSVETTVIRGSDARNARNNIQLGSLGTGRPPIEVVQAVAGQIQNFMNQGNRQEPPNLFDTSRPIPPPLYETNLHPTNSEMSNQSTSSQPRSSPSAESTTATQTGPTSRPHVHLGPAMPGIALSSYDPFLPCNSHHIRSMRRNQNQNQTAAPSGSRNENETENANNNAEAAAAGAAAAGAAAGNALGDSFMAIMSQFFNPQRFTLNRVPPRQGTFNNGSPATATNNNNSQRVPPRRFTPPAASQPEATNSEAPRSSNWTPFPTNIPGWSASTWTADTSNRNNNASRNMWDVFRITSSNLPNVDRNQFGPRRTIADFLSSISDNSYVEGESIVTDFFMTLARNLTWPDIIELSLAQRQMVESIIARLRPALQTFVIQRLLQGEAPSEESIARACERVYSEMRPYLDVMQEARLRESVDLTATINNYNQSQLPEMIALIVDPSITQSINFGQNMMRRVRNYVRQLIAIIVHCCQDGNQGFDTIVQSCVRLLTRNIPEELQQWTEVNSVNNLRSYTASLNVPLEDIQRYLVYRIPSSTVEKESTPETSQEPMETDAPAGDNVWVTPPKNLPSPEKVEEPVTEALVAMDTENLPDVLIGSEAWHNALPSEWVPIIARDTQRQRRQSSQKPFSDAYLSGLPPKRRKLIRSSKPQGNLSQVISDGVRHAINAAGVSSSVTERVIAEAGKDDVLQEAYKEQERICVSADLRSNPDFNPNRFPNAFKYFDK